MKTLSPHLEGIINSRNSICTMQIVFVDIVKYSKRTTARQVALINHFTSLIKKAIKQTNKEYYEILSEAGIELIRDSILIPTGDGLAIGMPFEWINGLHLDLSRLILKEINSINVNDPCDLFNANNYCNCHNKLNVRIGISIGQVILYKDINENYNIAGNPINLASRIMNFANYNQILFSEDAYKQFSDMASSDLHFHKHRDVEIKHGLRIDIYQFVDKSLSYLNSNFNNAIKDSFTEDVTKPTEVKNDGYDQIVKDLQFVTIGKGKFKRLINGQEITVDRELKISKFLVTQILYESVMGSNPSFFKSSNKPVESINLIDAINFCNELSIKSGFSKLYSFDKNNQIIISTSLSGYRLPYEFEWEYALKYDKEYIDEHLDRYAWFNENSEGTSHDVGQKASNRNGLFDMIGNVWEWCNDSYTENPNELNTPSNIYIENSSVARVIRGGSFADSKSQFLNGFRKRAIQETKTRFYGLRLVHQNI